MDLPELIARNEILSLLNRYAHGVDRNDWPLVRACYHPDAIDDHGLYQGGVDGLMDFLASTAAHFTGTTHQLGNHLAEVEGDQARAETSCLAWYRRVDRLGHERAIAQGVRYLDRLQRRDGRWAISHRVVVLDWEHVLQTAPGAPPAASWQRGARGAADPSSGFFISFASSTMELPMIQQALADKFAIEERIAIYNQSLDQGRFEDFLTCWCEDGVFDGLGGPYVGKPAIRQFTDSYDERYRLRLNGLKHFTVNVLSRIDGDQATSSSHLQLVSTGAKGARILFTGRYEDTLRRVDGEWLFSRRKLHQDMPPAATAEA